MENLEKMVFFGSANVKENKVVKNLLSISIWVYLRFFQGTVLVLQLGALSGITECVLSSVWWDPLIIEWEDVPVCSNIF